MEDVKNLLIGDKKIPRKEKWKRIWGYIRPEKWKFFLALFLLCINVAFDIMLPLLIGYVTNLLKADNILIKIIVAIIAGYLLLTILNQSFMYMESMILQKTGQNIIYKLRVEVFEHIEKMSTDQLNHMPVGSLVTRVNNYTESMSNLFTNVLVNVIKNSLMIIGVYITMLVISWQLSLVLLGVVVIVFVTSLIFSKIVTKFFKRQHDATSDMNTFLSENISGMKLIQIFNKQKQKDLDFIEKNENIRKTKYSTTFCFAIYRPFISFLNYVAIAITFYFGLRTSLNAGEIVMFYLLLSKFFNPVQNLADQLNEIQNALTASEKLFILLDIKPDVLDSPNAIELEKFKGKVEFKNVWFAYENEDWILKDVSFVINPGDTCAFVGATGAGKTTILSLIVRNFEIQKGQILIDDIDIKDIKINSLRKAIGQMLQDVFLFSGSIRTNITLYEEDKYTDEEINNVCEYVNADRFINKLPNGLDEQVTERGENFSTGQRQLLSFARTVLSKPQILILDEATANIDTETESLIQDSLNKMKNIGTMLVVAHRLSTIQHADNIIVLQDGKIIEQGNHQQLLRNKGYYYKLYELQFNSRNK